MTIEQRLIDLVCCFMIEKKVGRAVFSIFFLITFYFFLSSALRRGSKNEWMMSVLIAT